MLSGSQIEAYARDGFLVLDSGLSESQIERIREEILSSLAETESRRAADPAYLEVSRYRRFMVGLHLRNEAIRSYVQSPLFRAIGKAFIGNEVDLSLLPHAKSELYPRDLRTIGMDPAKAKPLVLRKGEVVVLHPLVVHGSYDNDTDSDRVALMSLYRRPRTDMTGQEHLVGMEILREPV
jgi:hypothetical protein